MISKRTGKRIFQITILAVVTWGIVSTARKAARDLNQQRNDLLRQAAELEEQSVEESDAVRQAELRRRAQQLTAAAHQFWKADPLRLLAAACCYGLGLLPAALFWRKCLQAIGQDVPVSYAWWAYVYGNLGKYLPGKAMVIVMRVAELSRFQVPKTAATITVFMETLTIMAVGGMIAGISLLVLGLDVRWTLLSLGLMAATLAPTHPFVLRFLLLRLQTGVDPDIMQQWLQRISWRLMLRGWLLATITWLLWGLSLGLVLSSLPLTEVADVPLWRLWLSAQAASALAVVLGFVSLVPGGAGVRELVLSVVLTPVVGPVAALSSAIWARIVWLVTELTVAGGSAAIGRMIDRRDA